MQQEDNLMTTNINKIYATKLVVHAVIKHNIKDFYGQSR